MATSRGINLPEGPLKRIHVYGQRIRTFKKTGEEHPCIIVKCQGKSYHCYNFLLQSGELRGVQDLPGGMPGCRHAVVWLETKSALLLDVERVEEDVCDVAP